MADTFEPGAAKWGNFINYYQFNHPQERLQLIPKHLFRELGFQSKCIHVLDIGCNSGDLTCELYRHLGNEHFDVRILGVDLDPILIRRCNESNVHPENVTFLHTDFMDTLQRDGCFDSYFQSSPVKFDIVFAFSITMWIHLNHGDEGLRTFLSDICELTTYMCLEPQPWKCYQSAVRRSRRLNVSAFSVDQLAMRPDVIEHIEQHLRSCGMTKVKEFGHTKWKRPIVLYKKTRDN